MFKGSSKGHYGQGAKHVGTSQMHQQCPPSIVQNIIGKNGKCDSFIPARSIKSMAPPLAGVANHFSNTQAPNLCGQQNKQQSQVPPSKTNLGQYMEQENEQPKTLTKVPKDEGEILYYLPFGVNGNGSLSTFTSIKDLLPEQLLQELGDKLKSKTYMESLLTYCGNQSSEVAIEELIFLARQVNKCERERIDREKEQEYLRRQNMALIEQLGALNTHWQPSATQHNFYQPKKSIEVKIIDVQSMEIQPIMKPLPEPEKVRRQSAWTNEKGQVHIKIEATGEIVELFIPEGSIRFQEFIAVRLLEMKKMRRYDTLEFVENYQWILKIRMINLPPHYTADPSNPKDPFIKNLSISNQFGTVTWPGTTDITGTDFSSILVIGNNFIEISSNGNRPTPGQGIWKTCNVTFYKYPKLLEMKTKGQTRAAIEKYFKGVREYKFLQYDPARDFVTFEVANR